MEDFKNILFLDIETVAATDHYASLDERLKVQWSRKVNFFRQREEGQTDEDLFHERAGIYAEFGKVMADPAMRQRLSESGFEPQTSTPEQFTAYMKSEIAKWEKVIRDTKISLD